ncbi:MAG: ferredoxin [Deltaproteobacteria bacterium]|nr:ferredoxin [Deltaproteobacteria bacterium]
MKKPDIDLAACNLCLGCFVVCPDVFRLQAAGGYLEVVELPSYPDKEVQEAINICPRGAIAWKEE